MNVVIYARFSSDNQREESIDAQVRAANEYAERNGHRIVRRYVDQAKSATSDNRPQFQQMIKDSAFGSFQGVIVHKLDRFARDRYDSAYYKRELKNHGVCLFSVLENLDNSPESIILESVLEGMAEYFSKNLAREVMKGMRETALQCKHTGGLPALGYDVGPDKRYLINPHEAFAVKLIFEQYASGHGYKSIVATLKARGYKTKKGKDFTPASLHDILRNEKYSGVYVFNRTRAKFNGKRNNHLSKDDEEIIRIQDGMPTIISKELFATIQTKMKNSKFKAQNKAKENYLLSGKIICGCCGAAMVGHTSHSGRNKTKYSTYRCGERYRNKGCKQKPINKKFIEDIVVADLKQKLFNPKAIEGLADKLIAHYEKMHQDGQHDIKHLEKELADINKKIDNIVDAIANGLFNATLKEKLNTLEQERAATSAMIKENMSKFKNTLLERSMIVAYLTKDLQALENKNPDDLKKIIRTYVEKVTVYEETVEVFLVLFVHTNGGGEPCQTRRKTSHPR